MGFFDFLKPRSKEHIEECWPGGKMLQVHIEYDTKSAVITYKGRYGLQFNVPKAITRKTRTKVRVYLVDHQGFEPWTP